MIGKAIQKKRESAELSGYSSEEEGDEISEEECSSPKHKSSSRSIPRGEKREGEQKRAKEEIEEEQKQVEEEFASKMSAIQKPKMLHFKFTEKIVESDAESCSPSPPPRSRFSYANNSPNGGSQSPARTKQDSKWKAVKPMVNTGIRVAETMSDKQNGEEGLSGQLKAEDEN